MILLTNYFKESQKYSFLVIGFPGLNEMRTYHESLKQSGNLLFKNVAVRTSGRETGKNWMKRQKTKPASYMRESFCQRITVSMFIYSITLPSYQRKVLLKQHFFSVNKKQGNLI